MEKIPGPALCGFHNLFEGGSSVDERFDSELLGAAPKPHQPKQSKTIAQHAKTLKHARKVLAQSHAKVVAAAKKTLAKPPTPPARGPAKVVVHGDGYTIIGASAMAAVNQPKVRAAVAKLKAARTKQEKAASAAAKKTKAAHVTVTALANQIKKHEGVAKKLSGKGGKVGVHGFIGVDANGLWPGDPGYDPTTDPDASGSGGYTTTTSPSAAQIDPNTGAATNPALDVDTLVAAANAAPVPFVNYIADSSIYPIIKYSGERGTPDGYLGSLGLFWRQTDHYVEPKTAMIDGTEHYGYVWGRYPDESNVGGVPWGGNFPAGQWNHVHGYYNGVRHYDWFNEPAPDAGTVAQSYNQASPRGVQYGPIVGNPALKDFADLRMDGNGVVFWMANEAPDWATAPLKAQAALTAAAAAKAQKDADAAAAAAQAKAAADAAAALAAQNAQNALDEANAASAARQQASQASGQSAQAQADADTAAATSQAADAEAYQQDNAMAAQDTAERAEALQEQQQMFQMQMQQLQQNAQQPQYQDSGAAPTEAAPTDDGSGEDNANPEGASDEEADAIDAGTTGQVVGELAILHVQERKDELARDGIIGGDGDVIGIDDYGNEL
jgi:hypothetical protein